MKAIILAVAAAVWAGQAGAATVMLSYSSGPMTLTSTCYAEFWYGCLEDAPSVSAADMSGVAVSMEWSAIYRVNTDDLRFSAGVATIDARPVSLTVRRLIGSLWQSASFAYWEERSTEVTLNGAYRVIDHRLANEAGDAYLDADPNAWAWDWAESSYSMLSYYRFIYGDDFEDEWGEFGEEFAVIEAHYQGGRGTWTVAGAPPISPVPLPATGMLAVAGMAALGAIRRRTRP